MKAFRFLLVLALAVPAFTLDRAQVTCVGGTVSTIEPGIAGRLDTTGEANLVFRYADRKLEIPYSSIQSFQSESEVKHHLGVLPAIAVGLVKARQRRHLFRIVYRDGSGSERLTQVVVFEVPKQMVHTLDAILEARAPHRRACPACAAMPPQFVPNSATDGISPDHSQPAASPGATN